MNRFDRTGPLSPTKQFYRERYGISPGRFSAFVTRLDRAPWWRFRFHVSIVHSERPYTLPRPVKEFELRQWRSVVTGKRLTRHARKNGVDL